MGITGSDRPNETPLVTHDAGANEYAEEQRESAIRSMLIIERNVIVVI
jgi:hypothetical protein